jgi:K(+)-stimulated pyrophosphate-energized sodium pump
MLHMLRSRSGCLAGLLAALLWTSAIAPLVRARRRSRPRNRTPARHAGGEANLILPDLGSVDFQGYNGRTLLTVGLFVSLLGLAFGMVIFVQLRNLPVHRSMHEISELIYETCKTYLITQGKFILLLELFIGVIMVFYFYVLQHFAAVKVAVILLFSLIGIAGSYGVAWFGIRVNTFANSRAAFAGLKGQPYPIYAIPLRAGMSIGMLLISVELFLMLCILLFIPATMRAPALSVSPSVNRSAPRRCASPAASSPRSPTSAPT